MEDHVGPISDQLFRKARDREIAGHDVDGVTGFLGFRGRHDILQGQAGDIAVAEPAVAQEPFNQLAADHAGRAQDQYVQEPTPWF